MKTVYFRLVQAIRWRHFLISIYIAQGQGNVMAVTRGSDPARFGRRVILKKRNVSFARKPLTMENLYFELLTRAEQRRVFGLRYSSIQQRGTAMLKRVMRHSRNIFFSTEREPFSLRPPVSEGQGSSFVLCSLLSRITRS